MSKTSRGVLGEAWDLYNHSKWDKALCVLDYSRVDFLDEDCAEEGLIRGWCWYYLGRKSILWFFKKRSLKFSTRAFWMALAYAQEREHRVSIFNGLSLALWYRGNKEEALRVNDDAAREFSDDPSVFNTRGVLLRNIKRYSEAEDVFQIAYEFALQHKLLRTAGHALNNFAGLVERRGAEDLARERYQNALESYKESEDLTGESAEFHIKAVEKKLERLK